MFPGYWIDYNAVFSIPDNKRKISGDDNSRADSAMLLNGSPVRNKLHSSDQCDHPGHSHGHSFHGDTDAV
jgi:hypothetical protein